MPHPIDSVVRGAEIIIRPGAIVLNRPQLALMLAEILTRWAFAEAAVGDTLAVILRPDAVQAVREFIQRPNSKRQRECLMAHAQQRLHTDDLETLRILLKLCEDDFKQRNKLAHWLSGYSPQIPDAILLMNPSEQWVHAAEFWAWLEGTLDKPACMEVSPSPELSRDRVFVYRAADFERIGKSIGELVAVFGTFNEMYSVVAGDKDEARACGYARLRSFPRFREERDRRAARRTAQGTARSKSDSSVLRQVLLHLRRFWVRVFGAAD